MVGVSVVAKVMYLKPRASKDKNIGKILLELFELYQDGKLNELMFSIDGGRIGIAGKYRDDARAARMAAMRITSAVDGWATNQERLAAL